MRYHRNKKIAFLFPSRTGSTTLSRLFHDWGLKQIECDSEITPKQVRHITPDKIKKYLPDFDTYKTYTFFRDPLSRFISGCRTHKATEDRFLLVNKVIRDIDYYVTDPMFFKQSSYCCNNTWLDFENFESEVKKIGELLGYNNFVIPKLAPAYKVNIGQTDAVEDFVRSYYADDYKLGKELFNKDF